MCSSFHAVVRTSEPDLRVLIWMHFGNTMLREKARCGLTQSDLVYTMLENMQANTTRCLGR